jgi:hypothetical protein
MLRTIHAAIGCKLEAGEDVFGKVRDFLFDEDQWTIRWMVADTGTWLPGRKVLVSPVSIGDPDWDNGRLPVRMTREEIEASPGLDTDAPVSRQYEKKWFDTYGWPYYWSPGITMGGAGVWAGAMQPQALLIEQQRENQEIEPLPEEQDDVLRSAEEVRGYHIQAADGDCGHVEDFIMDDSSWTLRYLVVDTKNWLPGRNVLIAPDWITSIRWADRTVYCDLARDTIKESPAYHPGEEIDRAYEQKLYDYYKRPAYWTRA